LIEPRIVFEGLDTVGKAAAADFARERTARRYNSVLNTLLEFWLSLIAGDGDEIRAFGTSVEVDAMFRLSTHTGYSRRAWT
jgi:thymidylate kinase